jgi:TolB protein
MYFPSGQRIVFQSPRDYTQPREVDLYTMDASGIRQRRLATSAGFDGVPVPSPDSGRIAFQRGTFDATANAFHWELFVIDTLGRNERQLTSNQWSSQVPSWRPGGDEIVFYANPEGREQLFVMAVRTRAARPLHTSRANDTAPAVSPDGRYVAFNSDRDGPGDLYRLEVSSGTVTRLTRELGVRGQPSWSRDGSRLLFSATSTGLDEVYVIGRDGSGLARLTRGATGVR